MNRRAPQTRPEPTPDEAQETLARLVEQLRAPLFAIAYHELRHYDNAQDAVANALLRVVRFLPRLRQPEQVQAWASRIVRNEARRLARTRATLPGSDLADDTLVSQPAESSLLRLDVERELRRLPRDQARASALFYFDSWSIAQIARALDRPEGTVKYWLHRTRGHLQHTLRKDYLMDSATLPTETTAPCAPPTMSVQSWTALIAGDDFAPATVSDLEMRLHAAGWDEVHAVSDTLTLGTLGRDALAPLADARLVVLGEQAGGRSAFEWAAWWRASDAGKRIALFLIADGNRPEEEFKNTALAAYVAGFDMLLSRPFNPDEFQAFARRIRTTLETAPE